MSGKPESRIGSMLDRMASAVTPAPSTPVLVDGKAWDGSRLGDVAIVMTPNRNVVGQHRPVARACVAAGLEVAFVHADIDDSFNPRLEDYSMPGTRIVRLPLSARRAGLRFPDPFVLLTMLAQLKALFPEPPFGAIATHIDGYGMCKLLCCWAKQAGVPSIVIPGRYDDGPWRSRRSRTGTQVPATL